jgi:hypothetical protein
VGRGRSSSTGSFLGTHTAHMDGHLMKAGDRGGGWGWVSQELGPREVPTPHTPPVRCVSLAQHSSNVPTLDARPLLPPYNMWPLPTHPPTHPPLQCVPLAASSHRAPPPPTAGAGCGPAPAPATLLSPPPAPAAAAGAPTQWGAGRCSPLPWPPGQQARKEACGREVGTRARREGRGPVSRDLKGSLAWPWAADRHCS